MAQVMFDDSVLATVEQNLANIDYDQLDGYSMVSEGRHLVEIEAVGGYIHQYNGSETPRAKLKMRIIAGPDTGKYQFDDINLPVDNEKQGNQNRRILIATRLGLLPKGAKQATNIHWKQLQGKKAVITVEHKESDKNGVKKKFANVTFGGYEAPETWNMPLGGNGGNGGVAKETWNDI